MPPCVCVQELNTTGNSIAASLYAQGQATNNQTLLDLSANVTATCGANKTPLAYLEPAYECANVSITAYGAWCVVVCVCGGVGGRGRARQCLGVRWGRESIAARRSTCARRSLDCPHPRWSPGCAESATTWYA